MLDNVIEDKSGEEYNIPKPQSSKLIVDPEDDAFSGFLGSFYTYFFRTTGNTEKIVRGYLNFEPSEDKKRCIACLRIKTGNIIQESDIKKEEVEKEYTGELVISESMRVAYVYLLNQRAGEICMITFRHWYNITGSLKCTMACAITTSSGANKLPTIHRICLSRNKISSERMKLVKGQMLMNDSNIILTENQMKVLLSDENIPDTFKELLNQCFQKDKCIYIQESSLYDMNLSEEEQIKWISYTRAHSSVPKYNKISRRTEESLYSLLEKDDNIV